MQQIERLESLAVTLLRELDETAQIGRLGWSIRAHLFLDALQGPPANRLAGSEADSGLAREALDVHDPA